MFAPEGFGRDPHEIIANLEEQGLEVGANDNESDEDEFDEDGVPHELDFSEERRAA